MTIGEKIALRRRTAGLSQEALAAQLGVSRQAVSRWETDESLPDTEKIAQLCRIFGVSADDLLLDKPPETSASARPPLPLWRRWFRHVYLWMGAIGVLMALAGLIGAIFGLCGRISGIMISAGLGQLCYITGWVPLPQAGAV